MEASAIESVGALSAERLFHRYFRPLYGPDADLAEIRSSDANPADNPRILAQLDAIADTFARVAPKALGDEALLLDRSDASVHRLAARLTRDVRNRLLTPITELGQVPPLVQLVTHGAIYLGACIVAGHRGRWEVRNPLWESRVRLVSRAGVGSLAVFQWWLKALSDDEIDEPRLADRYRLYIELPTLDPEELPIIAPEARALPRLSKVRYDTLVQYLAAHLPSLKERGLGEHFPPPERFAELSFHWLDFMRLGAGRMLLMHGPIDHGVHLFWIDAGGFRSAAFFPADALPEHRVLVDGDKLTVELPVLGSVQRHELLWWGG